MKNDRGGVRRKEGRKGRKELLAAQIGRSVFAIVDARGDYLPLMTLKAFPTRSEIVSLGTRAATI